LSARKRDAISSVAINAMTQRATLPRPVASVNDFVEYVDEVHDSSQYASRMPKSDGASTSKIDARRRAALEKRGGNYVARRAALLRAAADVFRAKGFDAVRMDHVADELGVDRATLYYYFGNKTQLFRDVITEAVQENVEAATAIATGEGTAGEKLERLIVSLFESYERHYPLLYVYVQEDMRRLGADDPRQSDPLIELGHRYDAAVEGIIEQGIAAGEFSPQLRPSLTAYAIIGAANWSHRWYSPDGELSGSELGRQFAELFLAGVLVGPARRRKRASSAVASM
jgi:AcrR family transcriptional regulator